MKNRSVEKLGNGVKLTEQKDTTNPPLQTMPNKSGNQTFNIFNMLYKASPIVAPEPVSHADTAF